MMIINDHSIIIISVCARANARASARASAKLRVTRQLLQGSAHRLSRQLSQ